MLPNLIKNLSISIHSKEKKMFNSFLLAKILFLATLISISAAQNSPKDYVSAHNIIRAQVGVGPVIWNETVAAYAQNYANSRSHQNCALKHSYGPYGENIAEGYDNFNITDAVKWWASEKENYIYESNTCKNNGNGDDDGECLHYTQIIWRNSVHIGCARAKCDNGWIFVICSYEPVGNIEDQRPY